MNPNRYNLKILSLAFAAAACGFAGVAGEAAGKLHHVGYLPGSEALGADGVAAAGIAVEAAEGIEGKAAGERGLIPLAQQEEQKP